MRCLEISTLPLELIALFFIPDNLTAKLQQIKLTTRNLSDFYFVSRLDVPLNLSQLFCVGIAY